MRMLLAPLWVRAVSWGLLGAVVALLASAFSSGSHRPIVLDWPSGTLLFVVFAVGFAALMSWRTESARSPYLAQVTGLTSGQRSAAIRATTRDPIPTDPEVLKAALRLGTVYLEQNKANRQRNQVVTIILLVVAVFLLVVAAIEGDAWGLVYPIIVLIVVPLSRWWTEIVVGRTKRQNRILAEARRTKRKKRT